MKETKSSQALIWATCLLALVIFPLYGYKVFIKTDYADFLVYLRAAQRTHLGQWDQIYTLADGTSPFRYMPIFLPVFQPLALFSYAWAALVWYLIQYLSFGLGFFFLYRSLRLFLKGTQAALCTCLSLLYVLRFCLDTFTIGQVSGLMFLGFSSGLWSWLRGRPSQTILALMVPGLFKIGPLVTLGMFLSARLKDMRHAFFTAGGTLVGALVFYSIWATVTLGSLSGATHLWSNWATIVANDSVYYDASHYGSQSLNSALLRLVRAQLLSAQHAGLLHSGVLSILLASLSAFWLLRSPRSLRGRALFFCLGLFPYMWLMPETFKYSLVFLAFPVAVLFSGFFRQNRRSSESAKLTWIALGVGALFLSLAGLDIVGEDLFFSLQRWSLPFLCSVLLGTATWVEAYQASEKSRRGNFLLNLLSPVPSHLGPWEKLPPARTRRASILLPLPLDSALNPQFVRQFVENLACDFTATIGLENFEILIMPYGNRVSPEHPMVQNLHFAGPLVRILMPPHATSKLSWFQYDRGSAQRAGFLESSGRSILIGNLEQPCSLDFYRTALQRVEAGAELVRGNRRMLGTTFRIPVRLLSVSYKRHRLGLWSNRLARLILPIQTTDPLSGHYGLSWRMAREAFLYQSRSHFLADMELSLIAQAKGFAATDLPVTLLMESEKSTSRVLREILQILAELPAMARRSRLGWYGNAHGAFNSPPSKITSDDWGLSPAVNAGILSLAKRGVVTRISMMAGGEHLTSHLSELLELERSHSIHLGIHFNLTYGRPMSPYNPGNFLLERSGDFTPSPGQFLWKWMSGGPRATLDQSFSKSDFIRKELMAQLDFLASHKIPVTYLDGHHHIHLVPGLLEIMTPVLEARKIRQVRLPLDLALWKTKQAPVLILGLWGRLQIKSKSLPFEYHSFWYPQADDFADPGRFFCKVATHRDDEIIVHPATSNDLAQLKFPESYQDGRIQEFLALQMLGVEEN